MHHVAKAIIVRNDEAIAGLKGSIDFYMIKGWFIDVPGGFASMQAATNREIERLNTQIVALKNSSAKAATRLAQ